MERNHIGEKFRRTSLSTTRDGDTWYVTRWIYDAATGLCTAKVYPDGSQITYTYTSDGLPLRETNRDGVWKESVYNTKRQVVGFVSSDGKQDAAIHRDEFGRIACESNAVALTEYSLDDQFGPMKSGMWMGCRYLLFVCLM